MHIHNHPRSVGSVHLMMSAFIFFYKRGKTTDCMVGLNRRCNMRKMRGKEKQKKREKLVENQPLIVVMS